MRARTKGAWVALVTTVAAAAPAAAQPGYDAPWPYHWGPWGIGMGLAMLVFWAIVATGLVMVVRWTVRGTGRDEAPIETLRRRYARGELTRDEFERMKRELA